MAAKPAAANESVDQIEVIIAKIATLTKRFREIVAANHRLENLSGAQQADIRDLQARINQLEDNNRQARERLQNIVKELPEK